jgi:hypothetical protein
MADMKRLVNGLVNDCSMGLPMGARPEPMLTLFSTDHCALCERALNLLASMPELRGRRLDVVDVAHDEVLLERYGPRLPVLRVGSRELDWPFTRETLTRLLDPVS